MSSFNLHFLHGGALFQWPFCLWSLLFGYTLFTLFLLVTFPFAYCLSLSCLVGSPSLYIFPCGLLSDLLLPFMTHTSFCLSQCAFASTILS